MTAVTRAALHHIALTVTDLDASISWYEKVFGLRYKMEVGHKGGTGKLLADEAWQLVIVPHRHDDNPGEAFKETRTGLDHLGLVVPRRADLEAWQAHLEAMGVARAPAADTVVGSLSEAPAIRPGPSAWSRRETKDGRRKNVGVTSASRLPPV